MQTSVASESDVVTIPFCVNLVNSVPFQIPFFLFLSKGCVFAGGQMDHGLNNDLHPSDLPESRSMGPFPLCSDLAIPGEYLERNSSIRKVHIFSMLKE